MSATMKISALAPWFGGKRTMAQDIIAELGPHVGYWEPFCGSMSILLNKPRTSHERVNDLHGDLINLARVIQDATDGPKLYRRLRRVLFSEQQLADSFERLQAGGYPAPLDRAFDYFIVSWFGRNGTSGTSDTIHKPGVRYTTDGGHEGVRWNSAVQSIPAWRERLRSVTILQRDAFELLERIYDDDATAIYCDPPYLVKKGNYVHDFDESDHARLAELLARFKLARVVVSYYDHPRLLDLYPGWTCRSFNVSKAMAHGQLGKREENDVRAVEVLLLNGPSFATRELF
jgi:DNA adenine methylase